MEHDANLNLAVPRMGSQGVQAADLRAREHLNKLAEQNRVKRVRNAKSEKQQAQEQLERGFSTHLRGANASSGEKKLASGTKDITKVYVTGKSPQVMRAIVPGGDMRPIKGLFASSGTSSDAVRETSVELGAPNLQRAPNPKPMSAHKQQWRYDGVENDDGVEVEEEDEEGGEQLDEEAALAAPMDDFPNASLDPNLLNNVAALSTEQQAALLKMLLAGVGGAVLPASVPTSATANSSETPLSPARRSMSRSPVPGSPIRSLLSEKQFSSPASTEQLVQGSLSFPEKLCAGSQSLAPLRGPSPIQTEATRPLWLQQDVKEEPMQSASERPSWLPTSAAAQPEDASTAAQQTRLTNGAQGRDRSTALVPHRSRPGSGVSPSSGARPGSGAYRPSPYRKDEDYVSSIGSMPNASSPVPASSPPAVNSSSSGTPGSSAKMARRRRRKDEQASLNSGQTHLDSLLGSARRVHGADEHLRQSLAALTLADKSNRGRIQGGPEVFTDGAAGDHVIADTQVSRSLFTSESRANLAFGGEAQKSEATEKPTTSEMPSLQQVRSGPVKVSVTLQEESLSRQGSRALLGNTFKRKVDVTNEKVQSAMADLQGVLAGLHGPGGLSPVAGSNQSGSSPIEVPSRQDSRSSLLGSTVKRNINLTNEKVDVAMTDLKGVLAGLQEAGGGAMRFSHEKATSPIDGTSSTLAVESELQANSLNESVSAEMVEIPTLPEGRELMLEVYSTWGDPHYVGLAGIDVFDAAGAILVPAIDPSTYAGMGLSPLNVPQPAVVSSHRREVIVNVRADPADINVLPEYGRDPRTVRNLVDGTNFTRDDMHTWLAPLGYCGQEAGPDGARPLAVIHMELSTLVTVSMIRIFNYNKSRTHAARGVRMCKILLDGKPVFQGELRMAPGLLTSPDLASECVLFTTESSVLNEIARHDETRGYYLPDATTRWVASLMDRHQARRPDIVDEEIEAASDALFRHRRAPEHLANGGVVADGSPGPRPATQAALVTHAETATTSPLVASPKIKKNSSTASMRNIRQGNPLDKVLDRSGSSEDEDSAFMRELRALDSGPATHAEPAQSLPPSDCLSERWRSEHGFYCSAVRIEVEGAWDPMADYVGLMGVQLLMESGPIYVAENAIRVENAFGHAEYMEDPRGTSNLVDGVNDCTDDSHSWLVPLVPESPPRLLLNVHSSDSLVGLRIWNYNKSSPPESVLRGVRSVQIILMNGSGAELPVGRAILRLGPGSDCVRFAQTLMLQDIQSGLHCGPNLNNAPLATLSANGTVPRYISPAINQDYETPRLPCGILWKIVVTENWNDGYFVGLDGVELFDHTGARVMPQIEDGPGGGALVAAVPSSINDIRATVPMDPRTPDRLFFSGEHDRPGGACHHPWLAPLTQCMSNEEREAAFSRHLYASCGSIQDKQPRMVVRSDSNVLYLLFQRPVALSSFRFYNYSKTVARGVRQFSLHCDHKLVYMGSLVSADKEKVSGGQRRGQSVILCAHPRIVKADRELVSYCGITDQDVLCVNERKVMVRSKNMYDNAPNVASDGVFSDLTKRPGTSAHHHQ